MRTYPLKLTFDLRRRIDQFISIRPAVIIAALVCAIAQLVWGAPEISCGAALLVGSIVASSRTSSETTGFVGFFLLVAGSFFLYRDCVDFNMMKAIGHTLVAVSGLCVFVGWLV